MSFTTFKEKSVSQKTVLVEIDLGNLQTKWFNHRPGVWYWQFNTHRTNAQHSYLRGNFGFGNYLRSSTGQSGIFDRPVDIQSVKVDSVAYTKDTSRANVVEANKSFFYDKNTTRLYVHFDNFDKPSLSTVIIGQLLGLSNRAININDIYYEPLLEGVPTISKKKDSLYFGIVSYDGGNYTFNNVGKEFDRITDSFIFGQSVATKYAGNTEAYADYRTINKGYLERLQLNYETAGMDIIDNRKQLSRKIPNTYFDQTTYPDIKDRNVGKPIPLAWGAVDNVPIISTNEDKSGSGNYEFLIAEVTDHTTGITKIVQIYVDGIATTWANASLSNATFELTTGLYKAGQKVTGDIQGFKLGSTMDDNALDVIENIMSTYQSIAFTSDNFNTTEWDANKSSQKDVGIFLNKEKELIDVIENVAESNFATFLIHDDGRYTWRVFNKNSTSIRTIEKEEFLSQPELDYDGNEFLTSVNIKYKQDWANKDFASYNNTISESTIFDQYSKYQTREIETVLTSDTDAFSLSTKLMDYMKNVPSIISIETGIQNIDLEIGNTVNFNVDRVDSAWLGDVKVEIVGIEKSIMDNTVKLTGRSF